MNCPKCGYTQNEALECPRCGLVFARYRATAASKPAGPPRSSGSRTAWASFVRFYRVARWISLGMLIVALALILRNSEPPLVAVPPDSAQLAESKIARFQSASGSGVPRKLELDEYELNGWLKENLAIGNPGFTPPQTAESWIAVARTAAGGRRLDADSISRAQSSIRELKIDLRDNTLLVYTIFNMHGMDLSLELEGRLQVQDGHLRFDATAGKLGSLPLLAGTLQGVTSRLFDSPENREKFKLPPYIQDITVKNGVLVIYPEP